MPMVLDFLTILSFILFMFDKLVKVISQNIRCATKIHLKFKPCVHLLPISPILYATYR